MAKLYKLELKMLLTAPGFWVLTVISNLQMNFLAFADNSFTSWLAADGIVRNFVPVFCFMLVIWSAALPGREKNSNIQDIIASQPHPAGRLFWSKMLAGLTLVVVLVVQIFFILALRQGTIGLAPIQGQVYARHLFGLALPGIIAVYCLGFGLGQLNRSWLGIPAAGGIYIVMISISQSLPARGHLLAGILSPQPTMVNRSYSEMLGWSVELPLIASSLVFHLALGLIVCLIALAGLGLAQDRMGRASKLKTATCIATAMVFMITGLGLYGVELGQRNRQYSAELARLPKISRLDLDHTTEKLQVELTQVKLNIDLVTAKNELQGNAEMLIENISPHHVSSIPLSLRHNFDITSLKVDGRDTPIPNRDGDSFTLTLATPLPPGEKIVVELGWQGIVWHWRHGFGDRTLNLTWFISEEAVLMPLDYGWHPQLGTHLYSFADTTSFLPGEPEIIIDNGPLGSYADYTLTVTSDSPAAIAANLPLAEEFKVQDKWVTRFEPGRIPGVLLTAGTYLWLEGETAVGWVQMEFEPAFTTLEAMNLSILDIVTDVLPPLSGRQLVVQLPYSPSVSAWQQPGPLLILHQATASRLLTAKVEPSREDIQNLLRLWWLGDTEIIPFQQIALQEWLTDYVLGKRDQAFYHEVREAHREIHRVYVQSGGREHYQPDPKLVRNPEIQGTMLWLVMDEILEKEGTPQVAQTLAWLLPLTQSDDFDDYSAVMAFVQERLGD